MSDDFSSPSMLPGEPPKQRSNTALIVILVVLIVLCCCCAAMAGIAWNFGDLVLSWLGFY
jgi:hypothetical protein